MEKFISGQWRTRGVGERAKAPPPPPWAQEKTKNGGKCAFFMKRVQIFGCTDIKSGEQTLFRGCLLGKNRKKKFLAFGEPPPPFRVSRTPLFQEVVW